ncbi:MAG TPA: PIN domain-containing protein [Gaiellaceae bacterium]|nr:PIN domain-containing protein [Gaiellaceae bacterium]
MALVLDTGVAVALLDAGDRNHRACVDLVEQVREDLVVPAPTLVEIDYWLREVGADEAWRHLVDDVAGGRVPAPLAGRDEPKVATLDRRHFTIVRPRHCDALRLLPE